MRGSAKVEDSGSAGPRAAHLPENGQPLATSRFNQVENSQT